MHLAAGTQVVLRHHPEIINKSVQFIILRAFLMTHSLANDMSIDDNDKAKLKRLVAEKCAPVPLNQSQNTWGPAGEQRLASN